MFKPFPKEVIRLLEYKPDERATTLAEQLKQNIV